MKKKDKFLSDNQKALLAALVRKASITFAALAEGLNENHARVTLFRIEERFGTPLFERGSWLPIRTPTARAVFRLAGVTLAPITKKGGK